MILLVWKKCHHKLEDELGLTTCHVSDIGLNNINSSKLTSFKATHFTNLWSQISNEENNSETRLCS